MTNQFRIPSEAVLDKPIILPVEGLINFDKYSRIAREQVTYLSAKDHRSIEEYVFGELDESMTSAFFFQSLGNVLLPAAERIRRGSFNKIGYGVLALGIWVNEDFFDEDHKDLIPYSIEHELIESWWMTRPGMKIEDAHLAARQYQFNLAALDGKAEKLLSYYTDANPGTSGELERAYGIARKYSERAQPIDVSVACAIHNS